MAAKGKSSGSSSTTQALDKYGPVATIVLGLVIVIVGLTAWSVGFQRTWEDVKGWPVAVAHWGRDVGATVATGARDSRCILGTCDEKTKASDALAGLQVAPEAHANTYRRAQFGEPWVDVDGNGCDTRDDILRRDLRNEVLRKTKRCTVGAPVTGTLTDPYSGAQVPFTVAHPTGVEIDHEVSLGEAWRSGAYAWTDAQRLAYANDPDVLVATAGPVNTAKSDHDAAEPWRECVKHGPSGRCTGYQDDRPTGARSCTYATRTIAIKKKYTLTVDSAEFKALSDLLATCT